MIPFPSLRDLTAVSWLTASYSPSALHIMVMDTDGGQDSGEAALEAVLREQQSGARAGEAPGPVRGFSAFQAKWEPVVDLARVPAHLTILVYDCESIKL